MHRPRKYYWVVAVLLLLSLWWLLFHHWNELQLPNQWQAPVHFISFAWLVGLLYLSHTNYAFKATEREIKRPKVCVVVPVYNEDPIVFKQMLESFSNQTRRPDFIYVVDDGSQDPACHVAYDEWKARTNIASRYQYKTNSGKREAQAVAFRATPNADIYVTIDSDTVLDPKAIEEGIKPFAHHKVKSVAGMLYGLNNRSNLLTALTDIGFVSSFLNGRAAWSKLHSVAVNCGGLAFYRADVVHKYLNEYIEQTVMGRKASSGDDRIMTNFALLEGWAVFQESSVGYTLLPNNIKHLTKQRIRWWRSFFWGGIWLIRRFSPKRLVWWLVVWQFASFLMYTAIIPIVLIVSPVTNKNLPLAFFVYIFGLSYIRNIRYLSYSRPDMRLTKQVGLYLLSPLSTVLHMYLCSVLQYVGLASFYKTGWETRKKVEVGV